MRDAVVFKATGADLNDLADLLYEVFPTDRVIIDRMRDQGEYPYGWTFYGLRRERKLVGTVGLIDLTVWRDGEPVELVGVGSVATAIGARRTGVARTILSELTRQFDSRGTTAVLLTDWPAVYTPHQFELIGPPDYQWVSCEAVLKKIADRPLSPKVYDSIDEATLAQIRSIHEQSALRLDGTLRRDDAYWRFYQGQLGGVPYSHLVCLDNGSPDGYAWVNREADRMTVAELTVAGDEPDRIGPLAAALAGWADSESIGWITFALAENHPVFDWLKLNDIRYGPESSIQRESLMIRAAPGESIKRWDRFGWSMADKF
jgi:predicted acetyltransferase